MNINSNKYVFTFALIICLVCAVMLSAITEGLRTKQELNAELEVKKNILKAVKLQSPLGLKATPQEILNAYQSKIEEAVIDVDGNLIENRKPDSIKDGEKVYPLYIYREANSIISYAFPIFGQGLWSTLYGYFALETDAVTVRGITFYKHGETPGLGAEIEKDWFQDNFKGKSIWSEKDRKLTPIVVVKGVAANQYKDDDLKSRVDGITAATLTANGVTDLLDRWLKIYDHYFSKIRKT